MKDTNGKKVTKCTVAARIDTRLVDQIDEMADAEERNRSNMMEILLAEAVEARQSRR